MMTEMPIEDQFGNEPADRLPETEGDWNLIKRVTDHFDSIFGPAEMVYHEEQSHVVHIDMHLYPKAPIDGFHTIVTTGLAERPMNVPDEVPDPDQYRYAELVLHLPEEWPMEWEELKKPENWWPLNALYSLAKLPHERESWVWGGHTLRSNANLDPYSHDTQLCAALVCPSYLLPDGGESITMPDGREVVFLTLAFLYREELEFCMENYSDAFLDLVQQSGLSPIDFFVLDKDRPNLCLPKN